MNREEIYDKAIEFAEERINNGMLYDTRTEIQFAFEKGAEWMQEQYESNTAHAFCEGVKEHYVNKACKEFCHNCTHYENCEGYCDRYKQFH